MALQDRNPAGDMAEENQSQSGVGAGGGGELSLCQCGPWEL